MGTPDPAAVEHLEACGECRSVAAAERRIDAPLREHLARVSDRDRRAWDRATQRIASRSSTGWRDVALIASSAAAASLVSTVVFLTRGGDAPAPRAAGASPTHAAWIPEQVAALEIQKEVFETMKPASTLGAALLVSVGGAARQRP